ncbi:MAG: hypothetical protein DRG83_06895 [Deltaproteobacteria bacterium]|nr:MAG: hypothetical protein DRG83_06895 [Deltaproteobacteria bacterium]
MMKEGKADNMRKSIYIIWNKSNELGIPIIDEQHRGIISSINSLYYYTQSGQADEIIESIIVILQEYVNIHFRTEEALLEESGYPDVEKHKILHSEFVADIEKLGRRLEKDGDSNIVLRFLKEWWLGHINVEDRKYAPCVRKIVT